MNQEQQQSLGQLHFQKIPLSIKSLITKKRSFIIILFGIVLIFNIVMGIFVADFWKAWPLIGLVELCVLGSNAIPLWLYERWKFCFFLYEYGIIIRAQGVDYVAKYEDVEITKMTMLLPELAPSTYTLKLANGFTRRVNTLCEEYSEYQKMIERALQLSYQAVLPQAREKINAGESLKFGGFQLSRDGIQFDGKKYLWEDGYLIEFRYHLGEISTGAFKVARANGELFSGQPCQPYYQIHNALVFINLLESMNKLDQREHY